MARRQAFGRLGLTKDETMRRLLLLLVMLASLGAAVPAQAEKVDGYYKEDDDDPIVDFDKMADNAKKLSEYCGKNPSHNIITAAEKLIAK